MLNLQVEIIFFRASCDIYAGKRRKPITKSSPSGLAIRLDELPETIIRVKKQNIIKMLAAMLTCGAAIATASCNKDETTTDEDTVVTSPNVAVTNFHIKADTEVAANLDSVFFSIDLEHGVIFNADSLPVGTKIDKLIPSISYSSYVTSAIIRMEDGETRTGELDYIAHPNDSIDFTGRVYLTLSAENKTMQKEYRLKVNVHQQKPDSLQWNDVAIAKLPARTSSPRNQKSVKLGDKAVSIIEEADGSYSLAQCSDLHTAAWNVTQLSFSFTPNLRSLAASSSALYILSNSGALYESTDGLTWASTGRSWISLIGTYLDTALGLESDGSSIRYAQYPVHNIAATEMDPEFPLSGASNFVTLSNKWTSTPVGFMIGGLKADGAFSDATWAFDGENWIVLSNGGIPAARGMSLIPYYSYRYTESSQYPTEYDVWMALGGETADGSFNRTVYISYNNGVNWQKGSALLQLPESFPAMSDCDNIVASTTREANLSDAWTRSAKKLAYSVDGDIVRWECPYIYMFGGFAPDGSLYNTIRCGVLNRLSFRPIF